MGLSSFIIYHQQFFLELFYMKKSDLFASIFVIFCLGLVFVFPWYITGDGSIGFSFAKAKHGLENFGAVSKRLPYFMGFCKVAILALFGEMIKNRGKCGSYKLDLFFYRFLIWGVYGMLFTIVFTLFASGVGVVMAKGLWFGVAPVAGVQLTVWQRLWFAFSASLWINIIFAYPMMLSHEWFNSLLAKRKFVGGCEFLAGLDKDVWGSFIPKSIVCFWIPAHTITFLLPESYRILMAASLSLALGFLLSVKPKVASAKR